MTAMGALKAIIISIVICVIIIITGLGSTAGEPVMPDFFAEEAPPAVAAGNFLVLFLLALFLLAFLGGVVFLSLRERRRQQDGHSS
jgi:hypothetical protein